MYFNKYVISLPLFEFERGVIFYSVHHDIAMYSRNTCRLTLVQLLSKSMKVRKVNTAGNGKKYYQEIALARNIMLFESIEIIK